MSKKKIAVDESTRTSRRLCRPLSLSSIASALLPMGKHNGVPMSIGHNGRGWVCSPVNLSSCLSSPTIVPMVEVLGAGSPSLLSPVPLNTIREARVSFSSGVTVELGRSSKSRWERRCSPFGPMSSSTRKPSGPTATLVGIPREMCC